MFCVLDQESKQQFTKIIHEISGYESIVQRDKADKSFFHVYGEQIQIGMRSIAMLLVCFQHLMKRTEKSSYMYKVDIAGGMIELTAIWLFSLQVTS